MKVQGVEYPQNGTLEKIEVSSAKERGAVVLTSAFKPAKSVNVVIYYHGIHIVKGQDFDGFLKHYTTAGMISAANKAGKPLAIGIPDLGANASQGKDWVSPKASFESLVQDVLMVAAQRANEINAGEPGIKGSIGVCLADPSIDYKTKQKVKPLELGNLIIAAHSGGGGALYRTLIKENSGLLASLKEVWMMDCFYGFYGEDKPWKDWANHHGSVNIRIVKHPNSILDTSMVKKLSNVQEFAQDGDHHHLPEKYMGKYIEHCPFL